MKFYQLIRKLHLFAGLILLSWIIMYFVTGLPLIHEDWLPRTEPVKSVRTEKLSVALLPGDPAFWDHMEEVFVIRGQRAEPKQSGGKWRVNWSRPGTEHEAELDPSAGTIQITRLDHGSRHVLVRLHRIHGYRGSPIYKIYSLFLDLSSIAVILFALTGIYLWYCSSANKIPGLICLAISFSFTAVMIYHLMTHP